LALLVLSSPYLLFSHSAAIYSLYKLVRPRTVLYLAVDGVAPRAKMNQQRSRRFRAAKEMEAAALERAARGYESFTSNNNKNVVPFDSNCITPGTDFMLKLSLALQKWVQYKLDTDPIWQEGADVIVSGPDVPGEGEHKVMDFIRAERSKVSSPYYRPNMVHVLYGTFSKFVIVFLFFVVVVIVVVIATATAGDVVCCIYKKSSAKMAREGQDNYWLGFCSTCLFDKHPNQRCAFSCCSCCCCCVRLLPTSWDTHNLQASLVHSPDPRSFDHIWLPLLFFYLK
jgi:hypothetical protein